MHKLDYRIERLQTAMKNFLQLKKNNLSINEIKPVYIKMLIDRYKEKLEQLACRLEGVSVDSVLKRGFAWVKGENNQTIYNVLDAKKQSHLTIHFLDGELTTSCSKDTSDNPKSKKTKNKDNLQETLFDF